MPWLNGTNHINPRGICFHCISRDGTNAENMNRSSKNFAPATIIPNPIEIFRIETTLSWITSLLAQLSRSGAPKPTSFPKYKPMKINNPDTMAWEKNKIIGNISNINSKGTSRTKATRRIMNNILAKSKWITLIRTRIEKTLQLMRLFLVIEKHNSLEISINIWEYVRYNYNFLLLCKFIKDMILRIFLRFRNFPKIFL